MMRNLMAARAALERQIARDRRVFFYLLAVLCAAVAAGVVLL